jgi:hypothetical protein
MIVGYLLITWLALWYAWRYSRTSIDPDWAMFNLGGFTGALYGRDFVDCKTPLIHLWYAGLAAIVGKDVRKVRFVHHVLVSLPGIALYSYTGSVALGLGFVVLINSGFLLAFHGNVGQIPAGMIALAIVSGNPITGAVALAIAVAFEPKLIVSVLTMVVLYGYWLPFSVIVGIGLLAFLALWMLWRDMAKWIIYQNITIPKRMAEERRKTARKYPQSIWTWSSVVGMMYFLPIALLSVYQRPVIEYWLPALAYAGITILGLVLRQNHLIPFIGWVVMAGVPDIYWIGLVIIDLAASGLYLTNTWYVFYQALLGINTDAKTIGMWLKDKRGSVWVNGIHSGVYIYAEKKPVGGMCEQIEIREVAHERREEWRKSVKKNAPQYVVMSNQPGWSFVPRNGYRKVASTESGSVIYEKAV